MKDATVAVEDKNFYKEGAFDIRSIFRAAYHDLAGGSLQGASTITEQLVKLNENWTGSRTIATKVKEVILAVEVDRQYTKNQILTGYLNIAPYGGVEYGVEAAAEDYFRTTAANLTLPQAAMLAAIPQSPSYFSPYSSTEWNPASGNTFSEPALIGREDYVLQQMAKQHYITEAQAQAAENVDVLAEVQPEQSKYTNIQDPYFVLAAKQQLDNQFGTAYVNRGGLKVITTLNLTLQNYATQDVLNNESKVRSVGGDEEAMVAEDVHTGQVVALIGGEDFSNQDYGQINYANIRISPGSSMKPFLYAALMQNNTDVGAGSVLYDSQQPIPGYPCTDKTEPTLTTNGGNCLWDDNFVYPGPETVRYALAGSRNVPAVKASYEIDPTDTVADLFTKSVNSWINLADQATGYSGAYACYAPGVDVAVAPTSDQTQCYGSAAIGGGYIALDQEVNGDTTLANSGQEIPQTYILKISDAAGQTVYRWTQPKPKQVYNPQTAYIINNILDDPRATYLPSADKYQNYDGWDIAVKTGTENQEYNGVMTAWSTQYAVVGFAGYHTLDKQLTPGLFEYITEPITRVWMQQALSSLNMKPVNWTQPAGVKTQSSYVQQAFSDYGAEFPGPSTDLYPSWYKGQNSGSPAETIDKVSGYLATSCTPSLASETVGGGTNASFSIDIFYPKAVADMAALEGGSSSASASTQTDDVHNCNDSPPSVTVTTSDISGTNTNSGICDGSCVITIVATAGTHPLSGGSYTTSPAGTIEVSLDGNNICNITIPNDSADSQIFNGSCRYSPTSSGSGTLTATVVDSVLYSSPPGTSLITYSPSLSLSTPSGSGSTTNFNWSGGIGLYTITDNNGNAFPNSNCSGVNGPTCSEPTAFAPVNDKYTLTDGNGVTSSTN